MKNKLRDIVVDNIVYRWMVLPNNDDGGIILKIWKNKKLIYDCWIDEDIQITPSYVADTIGEFEFLKVMGCASSL